MLDAVVAARNGGLTRSDLAAAAGIERSGGTFATYLGVLRRNGLVRVDGDHIARGEALDVGRSHSL